MLPSSAARTCFGSKGGDALGSIFALGLSDTRGPGARCLWGPYTKKGGPPMKVYCFDLRPGDENRTAVR
eukprot:2969203-Rhodomonas_salina.1